MPDVWVIEILMTTILSTPLIITTIAILFIMTIRNFVLVVGLTDLKIHIHVLNRCLVDVLIWLLLYRVAVFLLCDYQIRVVYFSMFLLVLLEATL